MTLIIVNSFGEANQHEVDPEEVRDEIAFRYLKDSMRNFETRELATYGAQGLLHPAVIRKTSFTPTDGGASQGVWM